ncbi:hypothetical protein K501DRAFT_274809 [Backusella circina FSU 941]|nr:hypothetical protein K501DRAFT_274809 [Backusella circina FSU 941]
MRANDRNKNHVKPTNPKSCYDVLEKRVHTVWVLKVNLQIKRDSILIHVTAIICVGDMHNQTVENYFKTFILGSIDPRSHDTGSAGFTVMSFDFRNSTNSSLFAIDNTLSFNRYNMGKNLPLQSAWCPHDVSIAKTQCHEDNDRRTYWRLTSASPSVAEYVVSYFAIKPL